MNPCRLLALSVVLSAVVRPGFGADPPKAPVPVSPFIRVVYGYADAMLKSGRDPSGCFWSALDRHTLAPLTNRPAAPAGVHANERVGAPAAALAGANPIHDENLLRLLSTLSALSGKPLYRSAADAELKAFVARAGSNGPVPFRPWMLWDRCLELAPGPSQRTLVQWSRELAGSEPGRSPRADGFVVRALSVGFAHLKEPPLTRAIDNWIDRHESQAALDFTPSLAIDCDGAARLVPEPLATRLRRVATRQDRLFLSLPHDLKANAGFNRGPGPGDGTGARHTLRWHAARELQTTAQVGMMCVSRYDNTGQVAYRDLLLAAAAAYLDAGPADDEDAWPGTFGQTISLEIAAWRHSANPIYLERARQLGDIAVERFWGTNALPRASLKTDHYESITGADTLGLALLELHLQILHITAVRCPPNTIDR